MAKTQDETKLAPLSGRDLTAMATARLRTRCLRALGASGAAAIAAAACANAETDFVAAPMYTGPRDAGADVDVEGGASDAAALGDAARVTGIRPLKEPTLPRNCQRTVHCKPEDPDLAGLVYPSPYEKCGPLYAKGERQQPFSPRETASARRREEGVCCYLDFTQCVITIEPVIGRPLRDAETIHVSASRPRDDWRGDARARTRPATARRTARAPRDRTLRNTLREHWTHEAAGEHASVAAFARVSMVLVSLGAPAALVAACHRAALDEVRHAELSYALASAYAGEDVGPGALPSATAPIDASLARLAKETLIDGCVGETAASLAAARASGLAEDDVVARTLTRIARDEARHAELAFRILGWALCEGGAELRRAVLEELEARVAETHSRAEQRPSERNAQGPTERNAERLEAHGVIDEEAKRAALDHALLFVTAPVVLAIIGCA